jgi:hypothetical protein
LRRRNAAAAHRRYRNAGYAMVLHAIGQRPVLVTGMNIGTQAQRLERW